MQKKRHPKSCFSVRHLVASPRNRHFGGLPCIPSSSLPAHSQLTAEQPVLSVKKRGMNEFETSSYASLKGMKKPNG